MTCDSAQVPKALRRRQKIAAMGNEPWTEHRYNVLHGNKFSTRRDELLRTLSIQFPWPHWFAEDFLREFPVG
jgi:hypothetical protein